MAYSLTSDRIILLGHSGFIGSALRNYLNNSKFDFMGINRSNIETFSNGMLQRSKEIKDGNSIFSELSNVSSKSIVINCIWSSLSLQARNHKIQLDSANWEIELIRHLNQSYCQYISFGSIAEIQDLEISPSFGTSYARAKKLIYETLKSSNLSFSWIRVPSCFGLGDTRKWILTDLKRQLQGGESLTIKNPKQLMNLCNVNLVSETVLSLEKKHRRRALNIFSPQWVTASSLEKSLRTHLEPNYVPRIKGYFSESDPEGMKIESSSIIDYLFNDTF